MVEAPDEFAHYWVAKFLVTHFSLPSPSEVLAGGPEAVYGSLPQIGYFPHALCAFLLPMFDVALSERFGSVIMGLIAIFASFKVGQIFYREHSFLQCALPLCLTFHPQFVFVNTYCNNDSSAVAYASLLLLFCFKMVMSGPSVRFCIISGIFCALIALSKYSALALLPVAGFALASAAWIHGLKFSQFAMRATLMGLTAGLVSAPVFVRNFLVFDGDFLGTQTMRKTWGETYSRSTVQMSFWQVVKQSVWWQQVYTSFWAVFGYQSRYIPTAFYGSYLVTIILALAGNAVKLLHLTRNQKKLFVFPRDVAERDTYKVGALWLIVVISIVLNCFGLVYGATQNLGGPQGRYLFGSEIPFMLVILSGLWAFPARMKHLMVGGFIALNAITLAYSFLMLYGNFGFRSKLF